MKKLIAFTIAFMLLFSAAALADSTVEQVESIIIRSLEDNFSKYGATATVETDMNTANMKIILNLPTISDLAEAAAKDYDTLGESWQTMQNSMAGLAGTVINSIRDMDIGIIHATLMIRNDPDSNYTFVFLDGELLFDVVDMMK